MPSNICRYLTALIAEGSFSKAAQRLGISQPSLSQFLVRLETEAQTELVDRSAKPLKLTAAGALFCVRSSKSICSEKPLPSKCLTSRGAYADTSL